MRFSFITLILCLGSFACALTAADNVNASTPYNVSLSIDATGTCVLANNGDKEIFVSRLNHDKSRSTANKDTQGPNKNTENSDSTDNNQSDQALRLAAPLYNFNFFNGDTAILSLKASACYAPGSLTTVSIPSDKTLAFIVPIPKGPHTAVLAVNYTIAGIPQGKQALSNRLEAVKK